MTEHPQRAAGDDSEPNSGASPPPGGLPPAAAGGGAGERWHKDHGADVPRTASGALPLRVIILAVLIFAVGFYLFRRWRQQYYTYGVESAGELPVILAGLGLG